MVKHIFLSVRAAGSEILKEKSSRVHRVLTESQTEPDHIILEASSNNAQTIFQKSVPLLFSLVSGICLYTTKNLGQNDMDLIWVLIQSVCLSRNKQAERKWLIRKYSFQPHWVGHLRLSIVSPAQMGLSQGVGGVGRRRSNGKLWWELNKKSEKTTPHS